MNRPTIAEGVRCSYCGAAAMVWDHVVPVRLMRPNSRKRYCNGDWIVPACCECNALLADRMLHNVPSRARWLFSRYRRKYQKLMLNAQWTDEELDELSGSFRALIVQTMLAQAELDHRLAYLRSVAEHDSDYLRPTGGGA